MAVHAGDEIDRRIDQLQNTAGLPKYVRIDEDKVGPFPG